ncbi:unnamed protein product [Closterium sp. NIES-53]
MSRCPVASCPSRPIAFATPVRHAVPRRPSRPVLLRRAVRPRRAAHSVPLRRACLSCPIASRCPSRHVVLPLPIVSRPSSPDVQANESLWAHASSDLLKPNDPAPLGADPSSADRDRYARQCADLTAWKSRDAAAYIALSNLLPESEEAHFTQVRTASEFLTAIKARYATPTMVSLGRLFLPFLFPYLASFEHSADLIAHLH